VVRQRDIVKSSSPSLPPRLERKYRETGEADVESRRDALVSTVTPFVEMDWKCEYLSEKVIIPSQNFGIGFRWFFLEVKNEVETRCWFDF
jgi:hypothetical protein